MTLYAEIILSLPLDLSFFYIIPEAYSEEAKIGSRVLVPFRQRKLTGFIINLKKRKPAQDFKLKEILEVLDEEPVFSSSFLAFTRNLSRFYFSAWGELLQASLPSSFVLKSKAKISLSEKGKAAIQNGPMSQGERSILEFLQKRPYSDIFLRRRFKEKNLSYLLSRLENKGLIHIKREVKKANRKKEMAVPAGPTQLEMDFSLDEKSLQAVNLIAGKAGKKIFSPYFLYGAPEKREAVYFSLIRKALSLRRKVLFLVPEISLTKTLLEKFEKKLGGNAVLLHSQLSERKKELEWQKIKDGKVDVVVGPRSCLFSPLENLGLVIVDEEQDDSYYQRESPYYDARRGAWIRAKQEASVLVYGSAVPSVEAFYKAKKNGYLLSLDEGIKGRKVKIVDDKRERGVISEILEKKIGERLKKKQPILVFINRRGYAPFLICSRCSYIPRCIHCDIALTYHKREERLVCHYCNYSLPKKDDCPECGSRIIRKKGFGIEAVEEELKKKFPQSKMACFDTDVIKNKKERERILLHFKKGKIDLLLGTRLLVHQAGLSPVSLVVVLYPETILTLSDFRASQKTFQSLHQMRKFVRDDEESEFLVQTALPYHFSIQQAAFGEYICFFNQEIKYRRIMNYPPFSHMAEVLFLGNNLRTLAKESRAFSLQVKSQADNVEILGPALASVTRVRGKYRIQVIMKSRRKRSLDEVLKKSLKQVKGRKSIVIYE